MIVLMILRELMKILLAMPEVKPECDDPDSWFCGIVVIAGVLATSVLLLGTGVATVVEMV